MVESQGKVSESQGILKWILSGNPVQKLMDISITYIEFFKDVPCSHCMNILVSYKLLIVGLIVEKVFVVLFLENGRYHFTNVQQISEHMKFWFLSGQM